MKAIIREVLDTKLNNLTYSPEHTSTWTREIADEIRNKLKELNLPRYKYMVQVVMGEQRGEGARMGMRCFWDSETDQYASETYITDSLFCVATAYGIYLY